MLEGSVIIMLIFRQVIIIKVIYVLKDLNIRQKHLETFGKKITNL